ncbi:putative zinc finger, ZZ domain containing 3 [Operophtera brumata]|uniref:Putative zinc finger, ZZ domain containing 3 n=1 Tax=Operophtera brumata TaxID=104452 RepID=A0A0L7LE03_OPEBR|nr:putative zinc finger, ZZ domain containing 3 [Operophtera brumata]
MEDSQLENLEVLELEPEDEFAFETDHLALRGNKDYCTLLKYIVKLEAQKVKALKDIEDLAEAKRNALEDPLTFIGNLKSGNTSFPPRQTIEELPDIDWTSYGIDASIENEDMKDIKPNKDDLDMKVRGRKFTDSKPETFNQLWSCDEQKRLEELLLIFPEEPVEMKRYKKIAQALGTRTPVQVMSRIQKYFAKLAKAGLPIPGRAPKGQINSKMKSVYYKKSTFFPQLHVPVTMEDPYETGDSHDIMENKSTSKLIVELLKSAKEQRLLDETAPVFQSKTSCVGCQKTGFLAKLVSAVLYRGTAATDECPLNWNTEHGLPQLPVT